MNLSTISREVIFSKRKEFPDWARNLSLSFDEYVEFYDLAGELGSYRAAEAWLLERGYEHVFSDPTTGSEIYAKRE